MELQQISTLSSPACSQWITLIKRLGQRRVLAHAKPEDRAECRTRLLEECTAFVAKQPFAALPFEVLFLLTEEDNSGVPESKALLLGQQLAHAFPARGISWIALGCCALRSSEHAAVNYLFKCCSLLERGLKANPKSVRGWLALAGCLLKLGDIQSCSAQCDAALRQLELREQLEQVTLSRFRYEIKLVRAQAAPPEQACALLEALIVETAPANLPVAVAAQLLAGDLALKRGDYLSAKKFFDGVVAQSPDHSEALAGKGWACHKLGESDEARALLKRSLALRSSPRSHLWLGLVLWSLGGQFQSDKSNAYAEFVAAARAANDAGDPVTAVAAFTHLGHFSRDVEQLPKISLSCYTKALQIDPLDEEAGTSAADLLVGGAQQQDGSEEALYKMVIKADTAGTDRRSAWAWFRMGKLLVAQGDHEDAARHLHTALRHMPKNARCWDTLGRCYSLLGKFVAALKCYTRSAELDPSNVHAKFHIASLHLQMGHVQEAAQAFKEHLTAFPTYMPSLRCLAESLLTLASTELDAGMIGRSSQTQKEAVEAAKKVTEVSPGMGCLWKLYGDTLLFAYFLPHSADTVSSLHAAKDAYAKALPIVADSWSVQLDVATAYLMLSRLDKTNAKALLASALEAMKTSISECPGNSDCWATLGTLLAEADPLVSQHCFIRALLLNQQNTLAWTNLGMLYILNGEWPLAVEAFGSSQRINYMEPGPWFGKGLCLELQPNDAHLPARGVAAAQIAHTQSLEIRPLPEARRAAGYALFAQRQYVEAAHELQHYCSLSATTADPAGAWNVLGLSLEQLGLPQKAAHCYVTALGLLPLAGDDAGKSESKVPRTASLQQSTLEHMRHILRANHARVQHLLGNADRALAACGPIGECEDPWAAVSVALSLHDQLSQGSIKKPQSEDAWRHAYDVALRLASTQQQRLAVKLSLVMLHVTRRDWAAAEATLVECTAENPQSGDAWCLLVVCRIGAGRLAQAGEALETCVQHVRVSPRLLALKSRVQLLRGEEAAALATLEAGIHMFPHLSLSWASALHVATEWVLPRSDDESPRALQLATNCASFLESHGKRPWLHFVRAVLSWMTPACGVSSPSSLRVCNTRKQQQQAEVSSAAESAPREHVLFCLQHFIHGHPDQLVGWATLRHAQATLLADGQLSHSTWRTARLDLCHELATLHNAAVKEQQLAVAAEAQQCAALCQTDTARSAALASRAVQAVRGHLPSVTASALRQLALCESLSGNEPGKVLELLKEAVKLDPGFFTAWEDLANLLTACGQAKAASACRRACDESLAKLKAMELYGPFTTQSSWFTAE
eukprot:TRINITY_DN4227_c0_g1_i2.p1 TRINITY_DN4227_c0_g1~~TRINITY_DN4227_c0_g1_i2.p1  ORF type:complete len:1523 (-),score=340.69 TRINITY_DN4227_c0_g1_i2:36-3971(-)